MLVRSESERSPGGGPGNLLQYSCLDNGQQEPGGLQSIRSQRAEQEYNDLTH